MRHASIFPILRQSFCIGLLAASLCTANAATDDKPQPETATEDERIVHAKPGPWGRIEYSYFYLEAPQHLIDTIQAPNSTPRWVFADTKPESLRALFARAGLPAGMQVRMLEDRKENGMHASKPRAPT